MSGRSIMYGIRKHNSEAEAPGNWGGIIIIKKVYFFSS